MKYRPTHFALMAMVLALPTAITAQDTIQLTDKSRLIVDVLELTQDDVYFSYPNERFANSLPLTTIESIFFESGRIQHFKGTNQNDIPYDISLPEPQYEEEFLIVSEKGELLGELEKQKGSARTNVNASALIIGIGKAKSKSVVNGNQSPIRLKKGKNLLLVKLWDNQRNPKEIFNLFQLEQKKKKRIIEVASANSFGTVKSMDIDFLPFKAYTYGKRSYLLEIDIDRPGEYAITTERYRNTFHMFGID